jgi:hypothetical protein
MIDFDTLVLQTAGDIFKIAIRVTPLVTQPGAPAYDNFGVLSSTALDVVMQDDTIFSDQQTKLGVRHKDFDVTPDRGDLIEITQQNHWAFGFKFWVGDVDDDGQGGCDLLLRTQEPPDTGDTAP